jgi:hypothetical protein
MPNYQLLHHDKHFNVCTWLEPKTLQYVMFYHSVQINESYVSGNITKQRYTLSLNPLYSMYPVTPTNKDSNQVLHYCM